MEKIKRPLFQIIFSDNSKFTGGTIKDTKWCEIPNNKKIKAVFYLLPSGDYLSLGGYERYYHFVEVTQNIAPNSKVKVNFLHLLGQRGNVVFHYKIDMTGQIALEIKKADSDFIKQLNSIGWKKGE